MINRALFVLALLMGVLALSLSAARAQTPLTQQQANAYYYRCANLPESRMQRETHHAVCACRASKILEIMSVEDMERLQEKEATPAKETANIKMLMRVMSPCMDIAMLDLVGIQCLADPKIDMTGIKRPKEDICSCVAEQTAAWFEIKGQGDMRGIILDNPGAKEPFAPLLKSRAFRDEAYKNLSLCMRKKK